MGFEMKKIVAGVVVQCYISEPYWMASTWCHLDVGLLNQKWAVCILIVLHL